jgi:hypothetical protein
MDAQALCVRVRQDLADVEDRRRRDVPVAVERPGMLPRRGDNTLGGVTVHRPSGCTIIPTGVARRGSGATGKG